MPFFYLPNLSAHETQECEPWTAVATRPAMADKAAFRVWCNNPSTEHAFISAVEGRIPGLRVSETNPASRMAGLILDYDAVPDIPPEQSIMAKAPSDLRPAWVSRTFSGHCRVLYRFEMPVSLFTKDIAREFVLKLQREFKLKKLLPGFEDEAVVDLAKYYEIGDNWVPVGTGSSVIPANLLLAWLAEASSKHRWDREGPIVPIDVLRAEGIKRFPNAWPNGWSNFEVGSRGPRFWDESATDPMAAVVRESGVQFYSDGGGFMTWEAIFGSQFIRRWADDRMGNAIKNFFYDGKDYWAKSVDGIWGARLERDVSRALRIRDRLFKKAPSPNEESEVERALFDITELRRVTAALPFVYREDGLVDFNGDRCLNISTRRPVLPVTDSVDWAEGFPKIAYLLDHGFTTVPGIDGAPDPLRQRNHFLSWVQHFYLGALNQNPARGLAMFIAGPAGAGKTVLNRAIIGKLMGGSQDASKYLLGEDKYNDPLFSVGYWTIDDAVASGDEKSQRILGQMVKQVVANDSIVFRRMYGSGRSMEWVGRPCITMNDDPESLRILPQTDINIMDKIMLVMMQKITTDGWQMTDAQIAVELPFFAAFLRDWVAPSYCVPTDPRFGVAAYAHPDLLASAGSTSTTASFEELLILWRKEWFGPAGVGETDAHWQGNPTSLAQDISRNESLRAMLLRNYGSPTSVGMHLNKMMKRGCPYLTRGDAPRTYAIARPE
jgi:hypothetical protein